MSDAEETTQDETERFLAAVKMMRTAFRTAKDQLERAGWNTTEIGLNFATGQASAIADFVEVLAERNKLRDAANGTGSST